MKISPDTFIVESSNCIASPIDNGMVILSVDQGKYYEFNRTCAAIWARIAKPVRIKDLCQSLLLDFEAPPEQLEADVIAQVRQLLEFGIVRVPD